MNERDVAYLRQAIEVANQARSHGNHPFGAILVDGQGDVVLRAENTVITGHDCTSHAELNLVRMACAKYSPDQLPGCTLYTSTEPCPMCSGAIHWSNIGRVVYALSAVKLYALSDSDSGSRLPQSRSILEVGGIVVDGPAIEEEAIQVHWQFWDKPERL